VKGRSIERESERKKIDRKRRYPLKNHCISKRKSK
jgi:hypothetical protein